MRPRPLRLGAWPISFSSRPADRAPRGRQRRPDRRRRAACPPPRPGYAPLPVSLSVTRPAPRCRGTPEEHGGTRRGDARRPLAAPRRPRDARALAAFERVIADFRTCGSRADRRRARPPPGLPLYEVGEGIGAPYHRRPASPRAPRRLSCGERRSGAGARVTWTARGGGDGTVWGASSFWGRGRFERVAISARSVCREESRGARASVGGRAAVEMGRRRTRETLRRGIGQDGTLVLRAERR